MIAAFLVHAEAHAIGQLGLDRLCVGQEDHPYAGEQGQMAYGLALLRSPCHHGAVGELELEEHSDPVVNTLAIDPDW
ncbi:MAG: hypothetical protein R2762_13730 [Bryobacteraceae bacterium]